MFGRKETNLNERAPEEYSGSPRFGARSNEFVGTRGSSDYGRGYGSQTSRDDYYDESRRDWDTDPATRPGRWTSSATTTRFNDDSSRTKEGLGEKLRGALGRGRGSRDYEGDYNRDDTRREGGFMDKFRGNRGTSPSVYRNRGPSYDSESDDDDENRTNYNVDFGGRGYLGPQAAQWQGSQYFAPRRTNDWYNESLGQQQSSLNDWDRDTTNTNWNQRPAWDTRSFGRTNNFVGRNKSRQLAGLGSQTTLAGTQPAVDIYEMGNEFVIEMDLPGYTREAVEMKLYGSELVITCNPSTASRVTSFLVNERTSTRQMKRTLHLPPSADSKRINAQLSNGVLKITIPKSAGTLIQPSGSAVLGSSLGDSTSLRGSTGTTGTTGSTGSTTNITRVGSSSANTTTSTTY